MIVKNIQSTGYKRNFYAYNNDGSIFENCVSHITGGGSEDGSGFFTYRVTRSRILNSTSIDSDMNSIHCTGDFSLVEDCKMILDRNSPGGDYFLQVQGDHNIFRGLTLRKETTGPNGQHGLSIKSRGLQTEYNLIENCIVFNSSFPIEARHDEVRFNVFRNIDISRTFMPNVMEVR